MKIVERYPANKLPADLLGDDIPADATVRVTVETEHDLANRTQDADALIEKAKRLGQQARQRGLTDELLDSIVEEATEERARRIAERR